MVGHIAIRVGSLGIIIIYSSVNIHMVVIHILIIARGILSATKRYQVSFSSGKWPSHPIMIATV